MRRASPVDRLMADAMNVGNRTLIGLMSRAGPANAITYT